MADEETPVTPEQSPEDAPEPVVTPAADAPAPPRCLVCLGPLAIYEGSAPHKQGTGFCGPCGSRQTL